ncbi:hypothetical protein BGW38_005735 [Lunasporangiospora selenospora]|uniref:alpha-1,2-Mannosidase n=1 Tax=Lunasporangiospora selenospora TaxID=979761 RepID=A0A9P6KGF1_9FUNG|nr:hypothetical protein BGW38_005735 [Lunasporangiospora selenospora]
MLEALWRTPRNGPVSHPVKRDVLADGQCNVPPSSKPGYVQSNNSQAWQDRFERVRGKGARSSLSKIQFDFPPETPTEKVAREERQEAVRVEFLHAWNGYRTHAWGHDEVLPISGRYSDAFNGWGVTLIDSLDTMVIMGLNQEFDEAVQWIKECSSFVRNPRDQYSFFETVIRYLGGLLSAYDLTGEAILLTKAQELGGYLMNAFQFGRFPIASFATDKDANRRGGRHSLAEIGTIQIEFTRLSQLTGDPIYENSARKIFEILDSAKLELPGLLPPYVEDFDGYSYTSYEASVGGLMDSYYEYLLKEWILLGGSAPEYRRNFEASADAILNYLVSRPQNGTDAFAITGSVYSATKEITPQMQHLACFVPGSLAMGSKYFDRPQDMVLAKQLAEACYLSYDSSVTKIGPEVFSFLSVPGTNGKQFIVDPNTFNDRDSSNNAYILRPETVESLWILYRLTGEKKYQDQAWSMFEAVKENCKTEIAYTGLNDVNKPMSFNDNMQSFFLAETMKYFYLIFSTPDVISLDAFVLNTEAHPIMRT